MLSVLKTSSSFSTSGHMRQADPQEIKEDVIQKRTGKKQQMEHAKHVREKNANRGLLDFKAQHPEIKIN